MTLIEWNNALYSVKIEAIDKDHQKLLQFINDLHQAMLTGQGKETLSKILKELQAYTKYHFEAEETLMAKAGYPELEEHKLLHRDLEKQLAELIKDYGYGKREVTIETFRFLKEWLFQHIQVVDKKYVPWLTK
jgi:hemerythrin-like metal-binding protein